MRAFSSKNKSGFSVVIIGVAILIIFSSCAIPVIAPPTNKALSILQEMSYTNIQFTGYIPFMKSDNDFYSMGFTATSPTGKSVSGAVTGGLFKGYTVRWD